MIDWAKLEAEYITTDTSYRKLAAKYNVSMATLTKHALQDKWSDKRKDANNAAVKMAVQKAVDASSDRLSKLIQCSGKLDTILEMFLHPQEGAEEEPRVASARDLKEISIALKNAIDIKRNLYGILTEPERQQLDIARQKLEIEREKIGTDDDDNGTGVIMMPAVEGDDDGGE